jgi:hypothetical protein
MIARLASSTRRGALIAGGALCAWAIALRASRAQVSSSKTLATTLLRALAYDTNLRQRAGATLVLAILYRPSVPASRHERDELATVFKELEAVTVQGLPLRAMSIALNDTSLLEQAATTDEVSIFYVCAGLEDDLPAIKQVSRKLKIRTAGGKAALVDKGISLAVDADAKPSMVVNLKESREEGAAFGSALLRLAKVIK